jgi:hypothetical protein
MLRRLGSRRTIPKVSPSSIKRWMCRLVKYWPRQWWAGSIVARVWLVKLLVDPFVAIVAAPHLTAHEPPRDRAPWDHDPPQMPEAGPSWLGFRVMARVARHDHITLHIANEYSPVLACHISKSRSRVLRGLKWRAMWGKNYLLVKRVG